MTQRKHSFYTLLTFEIFTHHLQKEGKLQDLQCNFQNTISRFYKVLSAKSKFQTNILNRMKNFNILRWLYIHIIFILSFYLCPNLFLCLSIYVCLSVSPSLYVSVSLFHTHIHPCTHIHTSKGRMYCQKDYSKKYKERAGTQKSQIMCTSNSAATQELQLILFENLVIIH